MAFATWQADPSDENTQALDNAEAARTTGTARNAAGSADL